MQLAVALFPVLVMAFALAMERLESHLRQSTTRTEDIDAMVASAQPAAGGPRLVVSQPPIGSQSDLQAS